MNSYISKRSFSQQQPCNYWFNYQPLLLAWPPFSSEAHKKILFNNFKQVSCVYLARWEKISNFSIKYFKTKWKATHISWRGQNKFPSNQKKDFSTYRKKINFTVLKNNRKESLLFFMSEISFSTAKINKEETDLNRHHCINIPLTLLSLSTASLQCFSPVNNEIDFSIISMFCFLGISSHDFCRIKIEGLPAIYLELRMNKIVIPWVYWCCKLIWHSLWWVINFAVVNVFRGIVCHNSYLHQV